METTILFMTGMLLVLAIGVGYYFMELQKKIALMKKENRIYDKIWENVQERIFLIDNNYKIYKTNFYEKSGLVKPDVQQCFGEFMQCCNLDKTGKCGMLEPCKVCIIRQKIRECFQNKNKFFNLETLMNLRSTSGEVLGYNIMLSGTYIDIDGQNYMLLTVHDISREKILEKTILKSNEKFLSVFNNLPVACAICDKDGILREVNDSYMDYLGFEKREDVIGSLSVFKNPCIDSEFKEMMRKGIPVAGEVKYDYKRLNLEYASTRHSSVKYYRFIVNFLYDNLGKVEYYVMIWVDNTLIHKTLRQNFAFQEMITFASSVSNIGFGSANLLRNEQVSTPEYFKNLGTKEDRGANSVLSYFENVHPDDRIAISEYIERSQREKMEPFEKDIRVQIGDSYHWIKQMMVQQVFEPESGNVVLSGVNMDIDMQKKSEEDLKRAKENAESSDKLKSAFLANMSHEIRTPLNAIVGFSDLLAMEEDAAQRESYRGIIRHNNELLLQLISDILDLSKIEADMLEFNFSDVDINALFDDIEQSMRLKNQNYPAVRIDFVPGLSECVIHTDRNRLSQVIINFINNSMKFTEKGSITFGYEKQGDKLCFYVKDTGCGIRKDELPKVFERFVKLNSFKQGTGLGLSICQSIVEHLEGEIGVDSVYEEGSVFWFKLPCRLILRAAGNNGRVVSESLEKQETDTGVQKTLLIAEDTPDSYQLYEVLLGKKYRLLHAWDGQEAVEMFVKYSPDAILMDIRMPNWNGYEATEAIRQVSAKVPIVAVTAFAFNEDKEKIMKSGFNGFLTKPLKAHELTNMLSSLEL